MEITEWKMKNGKTILLCDMEDSHLRNCIQFLRNKGWIDSDKYRLLIEEKKRRSDNPPIPDDFVYETTAQERKANVIAWRKRAEARKRGLDPDSPEQQHLTSAKE